MYKCDIVMPVWNQLKVTKACLESLYKSTGINYRLIIIDNGSDIATRKYLEAYKDKSPNSVVLVRNEENLGFIKAVNQGFKICTAEYACVLNNDTILAEGWLDEIIKVMDANPKIGAANPSSNNLGQKIFRRMDINEYAREIKQQSGKFVEMNSCIGFAMVIRSQLFSSVGYFDEIYGMGNFEDTDFCMRVKKAGYLTVRVLAGYVYHMENTSFKMFKKYKPEFEKNKAIFEAKWGRIKRVLFAIANFNGSGNSIICLKIKEEIKRNSWITVFSPLEGVICGFEDYSGLKFHKTSKLAHPLQVLMKVLFKKKKFDIIYTDDSFVFTLVRFLKFFIKAELVVI